MKEEAIRKKRIWITLLPFFICDGAFAYEQELHQQKKEELSKHCNYVEKRSDGLSVSCKCEPENQAAGGRRIEEDRKNERTRKREKEEKTGKTEGR